MSLIIINKKWRWSVPDSDSSKFWSRKPSHATNASDHVLKNIFREVQQKNVKRSTMKSKHTQPRQEKKWDKNLYLFSFALDLTILFRTKELRYCLFMVSHHSTEFHKIVRAFSWTVTIFNPRQWCIVIQLTQAAAQTDPSVPTISGHKWHQQDIRCVLTSSCPRILTWDDIPGPPQICSLLFSFLPRQWPPASAQTGPSVKSDPISKPFVKTFYVQQFLFVFVVRHSSSVPLRSHVPWLGHLGQKSQASSVSVTPGQIFIETRSQKCAILWPLGSLSEN